MSGNFCNGANQLALTSGRAQQALANGADLCGRDAGFGLCSTGGSFLLLMGSRSSLIRRDRSIFGGAEHAEYDFTAYALLSPKVHTVILKTYNESYAATFQKQLLLRRGHNVDQPNDLLGLAYAKANLKLGEPLFLNPIQRKNANYHEINLKLERSLVRLRSDSII